MDENDGFPFVKPPADHDMATPNSHPSSQRAALTVSPAPSPFSGSYREAREKFAEAAQAAGASLSSIAHPLTGPRGEELAIDTAWLGPPDAGTILLCISGVHGAEGYAGSGAQIAWLTTRTGRALPEGVAALFIHGANPWGFAHGLRGTEDNIDINRNWLDHARPHPANPLYAEIHDALCPQDLSAKSVDAMLDAGGRFVQAHGQWALEDAISRGQYSHPDGYHFGGTHYAWSTLKLQELLRTSLARARHVAYADFHSGPVGNGETIFLCFSPQGSPEHARAGSWWGEDALTAKTVERKWGSPRPTRNGIVFWGIQDLLKSIASDGHRTEIAGAVIEFCSAPPRSDPRHVMRVPMLERWMRFVGGLTCAEAPGYLAEIRNTYAPRRSDWENRVARGAIDILDRAVTGAAEWSRQS